MEAVVAIKNKLCKTGCAVVVADATEGGGEGGLIRCWLKSSHEIDGDEHERAATDNPRDGYAREVRMMMVQGAAMERS